MKKWNVCRVDSVEANRLANNTGLSALCAAVLLSRGYKTPEQAENFFSEAPLSDPFLLHDMEEACAAINEAVDMGEPICIYGDYDCDGVTSTVMLYSYLECMGADVSYYIPEREEGYGLNERAVRSLCEKGIKLIITVDNGVSAHEEAKLIYDLGMKLVITDHHQVPAALPKAEAVVDPHRPDCVSPFKPLCGAGVVLKLLAAMEGGEYDMIMEQFSDLAALATVADIVPVKGENRTIVEYGLHQLGNTELSGLTALIEESGLDPYNITATSAAFMLAPRINAAGRFASPSLAAKLLLCEDDGEAMELASELSQLNGARKQEEQRIIEEIRSQVEAKPELLSKRVLFFSGHNWHHGVIGIVSARLCEKYGKPCFIVSAMDGGARGSARGVNGYSVYDALLYSSGLLERFGGHPGAGGFSLSADNLEKLERSLQKHAVETYESMPLKTITAESVLFPEWITVAGVEGLSALEPFGEGNPRPVFAMLGADIKEIVPLSGGKHTKIKLSYGGVPVPVLMFGTAAEDVRFKPGDVGDFLVTLEVSRFQGKPSVSVRVADCKRAGVNQSKYFAARKTYEDYIGGLPVPASLIPRIVPEREDLASVYRKLSDKKAFLDGLLPEFSEDGMNYCKLRFCIDIFSELGLVEYDPWNETVRRLPVREKADLESSEILKRLRCL